MKEKKMLIGYKIKDNIKKENVYIDSKDSSIVIVSGKMGSGKTIYLNSLLEESIKNNNCSFLLRFGNIDEINTEYIKKKYPYSKLSIIDLSKKCEFYYTHDSVDETEIGKGEFHYRKIKKISKTNSLLMDLLNSLDKDCPLTPHSRRYFISISNLYYYKYPEGSIRKLFKIIKSRNKTIELLESVQLSLNRNSNFSYKELEHLDICIDFVSENIQHNNSFQKTPKLTNLFDKIDLLYQDYNILKLLRSDLLNTKDFDKNISRNCMTIINIPYRYKDSPYNSFIINYFFNKIFYSLDAYSENIHSLKEDEYNDNNIQIDLFLEETTNLTLKSRRLLYQNRKLNVSPVIFTNDLFSIKELTQDICKVSNNLSFIFLSENRLCSSVVNIIENHFNEDEKKYFISNLKNLHKFNAISILNKNSKFYPLLIKLPELALEIEYN